MVDHRVIRFYARLFAVFVLWAYLLATPFNVTEAGRGWCRSDPVFTVTSPSGVVRSFAVIGGADKELQSATYVIRVPPGHLVDIRWEYVGLAVNENTEVRTGLEGSSYKFSLLTTAKTGETAEIDLMAAERYGATKYVTGTAGTSIYVTYPS